MNQLHTTPSDVRFLEYDEAEKKNTKPSKTSMMVLIGAIRLSVPSTLWIHLFHNNLICVPLEVVRLL